MPAFLKEIESFRGTGEKNEQGQDLESFLEEYDTSKYENPSVTADMIVIQHKKVFHTVEQGLKVLMVKRRNHPSIGFWALPGGFVDIREDIDLAVKRELLEETGVDDVAFEQLYTWGEAWRDPRARIVTVAYLALIDEGREVIAGDDAADAAWFDIKLSKKEEVEEVNNKGRIRIKTLYELVLVNKEREIELGAVVEVSYNKAGIMKEYQYQVVSSNYIAFDHPRFIVQALLQIKTAL